LVLKFLKQYSIETLLNAKIFSTDSYFFKRFRRRKHGKCLSAFGEYGEFRVVSGKIVSESMRT
jgi:hypothetical protein